MNCEVMFRWKNTNLPKWIRGAEITQYTDRSAISVSTIYGNTYLCFDSLKSTKAFYSREFGTKGFRAKWEIVT